MFKAYAATSPSAPLTPIEFDPGVLRPDHVEVKVESCGICHSDISVATNEWGFTRYPFVPGHEVIGTVTALGSEVRELQKGQRVGIGWYAASCKTCPTCLCGDQNLCAGKEQTMIGRHGGFASHIRVQALWATPIPANVDPISAGPLFCGGITVFNPLTEFDVKPYQKIGVLGIGGLGHLALQFSRSWGCEVTAFTSSADKAGEAKKLGAHKVIDSKSEAEMKSAAGSLDFILSTVNADLNWPLLIACLAPKGRLHFVGAVPSPVQLGIFQMISTQASVSASPLGSPGTIRKMLDFTARHSIKPVTELFPMSQVNEAFARLKAGKARYRIVLQCDL